MRIEENSNGNQYLCIDEAGLRLRYVNGTITYSSPPERWRDDDLTTVHMEFINIPKPKPVPRKRRTVSQALGLRRPEPKPVEDDEDFYSDYYDDEDDDW